MFTYIRGEKLFVLIIIIIFSAAHITTMTYYRLTRKAYINKGRIYIHAMTKRDRRNLTKNTYYPSPSGILDFEFTIDNIKNIEIVNLNKNKLPKPKNTTDRAKTIKVMNKEKVIKVDFHKPLHYLSSFQREKYEPLETMYFSLKNPEEFINDVKNYSKTF